MSIDRVSLNRAAAPAVLIAAVALAGCSLLSGPDGSRPLDPDMPQGTDMPRDPDLDGDGAQRVEPVSGIVDPQPVAIDRFEIGSDGRTVVVFYWGGSEDCFGLAEVRVDAAGDRPRITVLEGTRPEAAGRACIAVAMRQSALVVLDKPLLRDGGGHEPLRGEPTLPHDPMMVTSEQGIRDARAHALTGFGLSADGLTLTSHYTGGVEDCNGLADVRVEPMEGGVVVTLLEGSRPDAAGPCIELAVPKAVEIALDRPLIVSGESES